MRKRDEAGCRNMPPLVAELLGDGRYYAGLDAALRDETVRFLMRHVDGDRQAGRIASRIASCEPRARCFCGPCPLCGRALQAAAADLFRRFLEEESYPGGIAIASLILDRQAAEPGCLSDVKVENLQRSLKARLQKAGIAFAVGGLDLAFNVGLSPKRRSWWQPQAWLFVPKEGQESWEAELRALFPTTRRVEHPVVLKSWDGCKTALRYALKPEFDRKERYIAENRHRDDRGPCQNVRDRNLQVPERMEVLRYLDQIGLGARIFLFGARMRRTNTGVRIIRLN